MRIVWKMGAEGWVPEEVGDGLSVDPLTLALAAGSTLDLAGGIAQAAGGKQQRQRNKARLDELLAQEAGDGLGITGEQEAGLRTAISTPLQQAAADQRGAAERLAAAGSGAGLGARELTRLREDEARQVAASSGAADLAVLQADEAAKARQQAEIEQRIALRRGLRNDDISGVLSAASSTGQAVGSLAGAPPATTDLSALFGRTFSGGEMGQLRDYAQSNPDEFAELVKAALAGGA